MCLQGADCASRGLTPGELCQHSLWWNGPPWLRVEPIRVPKQPQSVELAALKEIELRPGACLITTAKTEMWLEAKYSSYRTLLHVTAWVQLFAQVFLAPVKHHTPVRKLQLSPADITATELFLWKASQSRSYPFELSNLRSIPPQPILNSSTLLKLHPFWGHNGLLHIGGRLSQSPIADNQRFPIIMSAKDHLTVSMFQYYHVLLGHCGPSLLLSHTGNLMYVSGARSLARRVCGSCVICRKASARV